MQITLTPEIETILTEYAVSRNISPELLVQNVLKEWFGSRIAAEQSDGDKTPADHLADHIGVLSSSGYVSGGAQMSKEQKQTEAADALLKEGYQAARQESLKLTKEFEAADTENWDDC